jgi:ribose 5-phosphate isomerase B
VPGLCGAERAHRPNNAQVLCLGGRVVGPNVAVLLVEHGLGAEFAGGRSAPKASKFDEIDAECHAPHRREREALPQK